MRTLKELESKPEYFITGLPQQKQVKVCMVIPTYNESQNITALLNKIYRVEKKSRSQGLFLNIHVLVVDDNSPDGTASVVKKYSQKNNRVFLLLRDKKEGLGAAYIHGMRHALETLDPDVIFSMDADHSHDPKEIPAMVEEIVDGGYDFVIGSRYINGGTIPNDWGILRRFTSGCANLVSRYGMGLGSIQDCSGGFRAIKKEVFEKVILEELDVKGYAFQIALLENVNHHNFRIKEVPINFSNRKEGDSKMRFSDMVEGWKVVARARLRRILRR
jgi:dolichol-phosphate mannosyltransferase